MKDYFYFNTKEYKDAAMQSKPVTETSLTPADAFFLLIEGVNQCDLDLYCGKIQEQLSPTSSLEDIYKIIQNPTALNEKQKNALFEIALNTNPFGSKRITLPNGNVINTSSWMNHAINVGVAARNLATGLEGVNPDTAFTLGILHDIGRKFKHDMSHTMLGYEYLVSKGYENEARVCITHSHLNAERCANNEQAVPGWSCVNGVSTWDPTVETDDLTDFLRNTEYNIYDTLVNIGDLMATEAGIIPVYDRIADIAKRRQIDPTNRTFFFAELINVLNQYLKDSILDEPFEPAVATDDTTLEEMDQRLKTTSDVFYAHYKSLEPEEKVAEKSSEKQFTKKTNETINNA